MSYDLVGFAKVTQQAWPFQPKSETASGLASIGVRLLSIALLAFFWFCLLHSEAAAQPARCLSGYVWRAATPDDYVCVIPQSRRLVQTENALAATRTESRPRADGALYCLSGFVWREAYPGDLTCAHPLSRDRVALENSLSRSRAVGGGPDFRSPGQHTLLHGVDKSRTASKVMTFETPFRTCTFIDQQALRGLVGWGQWEPCFAYVTELAVQFDFTLLNMVPDKVIDRIVLRYDEAGSTSAPAGHYPGWTNGSGRGEHKPNGCVFVRIPASNWVTGQVSSGPIATQARGAPITRISAREWDVTQPLSWQIDPRTMPLVPPGANVDGIGFGLLLAGEPTIGSLRARDSTNCISDVWNITVEVTYTVPPPGRPDAGPR